MSSIMMTLLSLMSAVSPSACLTLPVVLVPMYEVSFTDGTLVPDWEVDPRRGETLDDGDVGIFFEIDKSFFIQNQSI